MPKTASADFQRGLTGFIRTLAPEHAGRVRSTTRLFESGVIDSQKVLDLISYVENQTGIHIPDEKITLENFRSILAITNAFWKPEEASR
jgi:acyl carrier protein